MTATEDKDRAGNGWENPAGTRGFEFVEYTAENTEALGALFKSLGFAAVARHRSKRVTLYRQDRINFIVNAEPESFAQSFARVHGPSVCAIALRVADAGAALAYASGRGGKPYRSRIGPMELNIPAIKGIGDSLVYLVDRFEDPSIYDVDFVFADDSAMAAGGVGLTEVDHLTHNVYRGRMDHWAAFYERLFNFRKIRYFDIEGKLTGLRSRAMTSPCGKVRIPINESADDKSQIAEYLAAYKGEGIQHIALGTDDIYATVETLKARGVGFMPPPPESYYESVPERLPDHGEDLDRLRRNGFSSTARGARARESCCKSLPARLSGRSFSRSFSARPTKALAKEIFKPCSRPSNATRSRGKSFDSPFEYSRRRPSPPPGHSHTLVGGREGERAGTDAKNARTRIFEQALRRPPPLVAPRSPPGADCKPIGETA